MGERLAGATPKDIPSTDHIPEATFRQDRIPPSPIEVEALKENHAKFPPNKGNPLKPTDRMRKVTTCSHRVTF